MSAVGPRACVVLEHPSLPCHRVVQLSVRRGEVTRAALNRVPPAIDRNRDRHRIQLEAARMCRASEGSALSISVVSRMSRLRSNRRLTSWRRSTASRARDCATDDSWLPMPATTRNATSAIQFSGSEMVNVTDRREEEVVECQHAGDGRGRCHPEARQRRRAQNDEQQHQCDGGGICDGQEPQPNDDHGQCHYRRSQADEPGTDARIATHTYSLVDCNGYFSSGSRSEAPGSQGATTKNTGVFAGGATPRAGMPRPRGATEIAVTVH